MGMIKGLLVFVTLLVVSVQVVSATNHLQHPQPPERANAPIPIAPGHRVIPNDDYTWVEMDANDEPLGLWVWCPYAIAWDLHIYNEGIPTAPWVMPRTGDAATTAWFARVVYLMVAGALSALVFIKKEVN